VLAGTRDAPGGAVVNVGTGERATILSVARRILRALGRPEDTLDVTGRFRAGDVRHAVADVALARRLLGWEPRTSLETGLARLIEWAREAHSD